ncbi:hypothetical protein [Melittangium boletus]|uniref:Long-chain-fatty-acid--CoA ligase n=1 Tax=Melittangium boletus DSM 14713 TaxID=1294270 RepID=A0A250IF77_9BACT|nr:hypothetical protein [Melittangium boletus]ATB30415.1 long-chain-fatty-acid--CoA ligase [Melittangium boletus DSM 14713]
MGVMDERGFLRIVDRKKDMILVWNDRASPPTRFLEGSNGFDYMQVIVFRVE